MRDAAAAASDERWIQGPSFLLLLFDETRWENYFSLVRSFSAKLEGGEKRRKAIRPLPSLEGRKEGVLIMRAVLHAPPSPLMFGKLVFFFFENLLCGKRRK